MLGPIEAPVHFDLRPLLNPTTNPLLLLAELPLAVLISTASNRLPALLP